MSAFFLIASRCSAASKKTPILLHLIGKWSNFSLELLPFYGVYISIATFKSALIQHDVCFCKLWFHLGKIDDKIGYLWHCYPEILLQISQDQAQLALHHPSTINMATAIMPNSSFQNVCPQTKGWRYGGLTQHMNTTSCALLLSKPWYCFSLC